MKKILLTVIIITFIFEILMFPKEAMYYAASGLTLWFDTMIPALFPFMVISALVVRLNIAPYIVSFLHPLLKILFRTNLYCEYAIVMGFLCGYPMGAIVIKDLLQEQKITISQADYLLGFCNNIGPVFFCSVVLPIFKPEHRIILIIGMYAIPLLYGIILRFFYKKAFLCTDNNYAKKQQEDAEFTEAFRESMNQAVSASLYLGACMIFFNMLRFLPSHYFTGNLLIQAMFSWLLEVNGAIAFTGELYQKGVEIFTLLMIPLLSLGGLSCIAQTAGIIGNTQCNMFKHLLHKSIQTILWFLLTLLWLLLCYPWNYR